MCIMSSPKKIFLPDPDYEISEVVRERVRQKEEKDNKEKLEKLTNIINRQFQTELEHRQSQLELIQQRLNQAQKTLHLLRYILITSYYNENEKLVNQLDDSLTSNENTSALDKKRLHPAVKKLLGNNLNSCKLNLAKTPRKRMRHIEQHEENSPTSQTRANSVENVVHLNKSNSQQSRTENLKSSNMNEEFDTGRNRRKSKYRVVVGNISKWMPSESEEDKSTHKWMVYVRGSKESPDISHFVQKVVFYLHPSYQPNDVIELREGPFHLARRGWGEFPLRVKIFFRCPLNKPVDIIHHLKLDKTFTGRQTLGNETLVNLFLYDNNKLNEEPINAVECQLDQQVTIKSEPEEINEDDFHICENKLELDVQLDETKPNYTNVLPHYEHDYCYIGITQDIKHEVDPTSSILTEDSKSVIQNHLMEHSYFQSNLSSHTHTDNTEFTSTTEEPQTDLIYGIGNIDENKSEVVIEAVLDELKIPAIQNPPYNFQRRVVMSNGTVIAIKKRRRPQESLLKKMFQKTMGKKIGNANSTAENTENSYGENTKRFKHEVTENYELIDYEKYKIDFPNHRFKTVSEALPYLLKRMPLITDLVSDLNYKCTYPYAAKSLDEYSTWNIGKRLSSEWFQAKVIQKMLISLELPDAKNWTVKCIIMYARSHGYTPLANYEIFKNQSNVSKEISNGVYHNDCISINSRSSNAAKLTEPDIVVDIMNCNPEPEQPKTLIRKPRLIDHNLEMACSYVKHALLDVGVILKPEEIIPGVLFNAAERVVLQAGLCLAEDLIRKARAHVVREGNVREETSFIGTEEIRRALRERREFHVLLKTLIND